ncbi:hypothetical protein C8T65DRAFT_592686 [Cerioporus squamosus]|nr:hypothetical protein C8T65DRAFT_592686 [Cerioporus squamosus]
MPPRGPRTPLPLLDAEGHVFAVLAGSPRDEASWSTAVRDATKAMQDLEAEYRFPANAKPNRRGPYPSATVGVSYGGGQKRPSNIAQGRNADAINNILKSPSIIRLAGFINSAFNLFAPELHKHYHKNFNNILKSDPTLRRPFDNSVFAAATFKLGGRVATKIHLDHLNHTTGWCAVVALGDFDPKTGGHLVLWDLRIAVEFPPGAVIFIPSAILRHSNIPVAEHETRMSFTQFTAGGLFRWEECGFRSQKDFEANGLQHAKSGEQRFREGIARLGIWDALKASALERSRAV